MNDTERDKLIDEISECIALEQMKKTPNANFEAETKIAKQGIKSWFSDVGENAKKVDFLNPNKKIILEIRLCLLLSGVLMLIVGTTLGWILGWIISWW